MDDPLAHVTWPEEAQLLQDEYWGPRLRAVRARALLRRLALGLTMFGAVSIIAAVIALRDRLPEGW